MISDFRHHLRGSAAALALAAGMAATSVAAQADTRLLRAPDLSGNQLAFVYAGDIYVAKADGSSPRRLTSSPAEETDPKFSPDGSMIAFSAEYDGNRDVYVIPVDGGVPRRLTWHPGNDHVKGWSPDGKRVAFISGRESDHGRSGQLFHVNLSGGLPDKAMNARMVDVARDAEASRLAYIPFGPAYSGLYGGSAGWRGYRGGTTPSITVISRDGTSAMEIPGDGVNDIRPMWMDGDVLFLSDREDKVFNLYRFDTASAQLSKLTSEDTWDIRDADVDGGRVVYEVGGQLKILDVAAGTTTTLGIDINTDLPQARPQWKDVAGQMEGARLSPTGKRVIVTARGEIFTVPTDKGSVRNITQTDGAREYTGIWSPKGDRIAYIDASAEDQVLVIEDQDGLGDTQRFPLGAAFHSLHHWSPDGSRIAVVDHQLNLKVISLDDGDITLVSTGARREAIDAAFSPDGRWIAYTEEQPNFNRAIKLRDLNGDRVATVADAMADSASPVFSRDGKYLYFTASTNSGPQQVGLDMSSQEQPYRAGIYAAVLAADGVSPLVPETGDEEAASEDDDDKKDKKDKKKDDKPATRIDLEGLSDRLVSLELAEDNYDDLVVAKDGALFFVRGVQPGDSNTPPGESEQSDSALMRYDFEKREASSLMQGVGSVDISADGEHLLITDIRSQLKVAKAGASLDAKPVDLSGLRMRVDPRAEWAQIFDEAWRMEKHYFYDPDMHGLDWQAIYDRYRPLVDHVGRREDLNALLVEMIAEMHVGHNNVGGGDVYRPNEPSVGLLGANLEPEDGLTRIARIYSGEKWNPFVGAPLARPGLGISEGDYILAVNGQRLGATDNIFAALQNTTGKQVTLTVASRADGRDAREVVVEPTGSERALRLWSWVEDNRRQVAQATDGKVGYVYLPNTAGAGYTFFNRMFFAQVDKEAMIIDERANGGGQAANYITDVLSRTYLSGWKDRDGLVFNTPGGAMYGPKVMLIDQDAGSGGDFLPYSFREMNIGPLIGTRTWGGLIGISANPSLIDGGFVTVPFFRFFDVDYEWSVENEGVAPDIEVALDPVAANRGVDSQLQRAIKEVMDRLEANPGTVPTEAPAYPDELGE